MRRQASPLKLFPAKRPLESVAIDILGPLTQTVRKHRFLLVMTCRYSKLTRVVPLVKITALSVAKGFCNDWVFPYGPPAELISDKGSQFVAKFFRAVCRHLGIANRFTTRTTLKLMVK